MTKTKSSSRRGAVACGHEATASAAIRMLQEGGNAFDAVFAAHFAACIAEPVLASIGGGGFLLAKPAGFEPVTYDFFAHTPHVKKSENDTDFFPIQADFGETTQEFHIGAGSIATPGSIKGMFELFRAHCSLPLNILFEPAIEIARHGITVNTFQAYVYSIIRPILSAHPSTFQIFKSPSAGDKSNSLIGAGELLIQSDMADTLEALRDYGDDLFYHGEMARQIDEFSRQHGGHISLSDLNKYRVIKRKPLQCQYRQHNIFLNPPPSSGGLLIAFALKQLENFDISKIEAGSPQYINLLCEVVRITNKFRNDKNINPDQYGDWLDPDIIKQYAVQLSHHPAFNRGTTHISVIDSEDNVASLTVSNGEGCGYTLPGRGFMLNNMLGEEDLNPGGFHRWPVDVRMSSMMCPTLIESSVDQPRLIALGSGGSNRIRSAMLQVIIQLVDYGKSLVEAVEFPRLHFENDELNLENGFNNPDLKNITGVGNIRIWSSKNMYFGGVNAVSGTNQIPGHQNGAGDSRRDGQAKVI